MSNGILADQVAIVTGFTGSIGEAIARRLAGEGARIVGCGRKPEVGEPAAETLRNEGLDVRFIAANLDSEAAVKEVVDQTMSAFGRIDIVINNAAAVDVIRSGNESNVETLPTETLQYELVINLFAPFWFFKHVIPIMRAAGGGAFVNSSTSSAHRPQAGMPAYAASKSALEGLSKQVAAEYGPDNIRSNCIIIGAIRNSLNSRLHEHPKAGPALRQQQVLDFAGMPEFIADTALYLASDLSRFTTGSCIPVEGGTLIKSIVPDPAAVWREMQSEG